MRPLASLCGIGSHRPRSQVIVTSAPPPPAWNPESLFSNSEHGFIADIQDGSSLFTDIGKTTLASNSDTVAVVANSVNSYDMEQAGSTNRAKLNSLGSYNFLYGDGVDDYYQVNFGTALTQPMTYVGVWLSVSGGVSSAYYYDGMDTSHRNSLILQTDDELQQWAGTSTLLSTGNVPGTKEIVYNEFNGNYSHVRINNSYVCGPGNSGPDGPGSKMYILTRFSITSNAQHRLYWLMAINRVLTAGEQTDIHTYLKAHCGVSY